MTEDRFLNSCFLHNHTRQAVEAVRAALRDGQEMPVVFLIHPADKRYGRR
jgi:hypothetical protein